MPAIRSPKGNSPDDNDKGNGKGKGKAPAPISPITRPKKSNKEKVDPCEVCGFVVSRKSDVARHAKRHAIGDDEKLPCRWEGCKFSTLQKSNLETHYRRHTQEKSRCKDDPNCTFKSCDPASMLRHRKRWHGYIPRSSKRKSENPTNKHVPVRDIRGVEMDSPGSASVTSQFPSFPSAEGSTSASSSSQAQPFFAEASTSGSSSSQPFYAEAWGSSSSAPLWPPESPTPSPSPPFSSSSSFSSSPRASPTASGSNSRHLSPHSLSASPSPVASGSQPRQQPESRLRLYSPTYSSGESEISPTTPITYPDMTTEGHSPTILAMTSYSVYGDSLLFAPPVYVDPSCPITSEMLDGCWMESSCGSENFQYKGQHSLDVVCDASVISVGGGDLSPPFNETEEWEWLRSDGLSLDELQLLSSRSPQVQVGQHPIRPVYYNTQIEGFEGNGYDIRDWM